MVTNNIMMKLKNKADVEKVRALLESMQGGIDTLLSVKVYPNIGESPFVYDLLYVSEFNDLEGLGQYVVHPVHVSVNQQIEEYVESMAMVTY